MVGALFLFGKRGLNLLHAPIRRHSSASSASVAGAVGGDRRDPKNRWYY